MLPQPSHIPLPLEVWNERKSLLPLPHTCPPAGTAQSRRWGGDGVIKLKRIESRVVGEMGEVLGGLDDHAIFISEIYIYIMQKLRISEF